MSGLIARRGMMITGGGEYAVERSKNAPIMTAFWNAYGTNGTIEAGRLSNPYHITMEEASSFSGEDLNPTGGNKTSIFYPQRNNITNFDEFQYFTGVTTIPAYCFSACVKLASIKFHSYLTTIGRNALEAGSNTYKPDMLPIDIVLPDSVVSISHQAFRGTGIKSFTANGVTVVATAFDWCKALESIHLESLTAWPQNDIAGSDRPVSNLKEIYTPHLASVNGTFLLQSSPGGPLRWTIGPITSFSRYWNYLPLTTIILSKWCTTIPAYFSNIARPAKSNITISYEVEEGNTTFDIRSGCICKISNNTIIKFPQDSTATIEIPNSVTAIGNYAGAMTYLGKVILPDTITTIGNSAFGTGSSYTNCGVSSIVIGSGVTSIGSSAFDYNGRLTDITCRATTPPTLGSNALRGTTALTAIYVPSASVNAYKAKSGWSAKADIIQAIPE